MGKKKIVMDTNNIISAFGWGGNSRKILKKVEDEECELLISLKQISEIERVLNYPKFNFSGAQKRNFMEFLSEIAVFVETTLILNIVRDEKDNMLIECAVQFGAEVIISGDDDLLVLKEYHGVKILSATEFLNL